MVNKLKREIDNPIDTIIYDIVDKHLPYYHKYNINANKLKIVENDQVNLIKPTFGNFAILDFTLNNPDYAIFAPFTLPLYSNELNYRKSIFSGWSQGTDLSTEFEGFKNTIFFRTLFWPDEPEFAYLLLGVILIFTSVCLSLFLKVNRKKLFFNFIMFLSIVTLEKGYNWLFIFIVYI